MSTTNKYDRQLRLWGPQGQKHLSESKLLILNAHPSSTEALKNLVLPGCGYFTIVDNQILTERDLGTNFFCSPDYLNHPRGLSITKNLIEMNPEDVKGDYINEDPLKKCLEDSFIENYDLIIASNFPRKTLIELSEKQLSHVPFLVILAKHIQIYQQNNNNQPPQTFQEKINFKQQIRDEMKKYLLPKDQENYEEAIKYSYWACKNNQEIPENLQKIFLLEEQISIDNKNKFWLLVKNLKLFLKENNNYMPIQKTIPDMKSTSQWYIELKEIYVNKHNQDKIKFLQILNKNFPLVTIDNEFVETFLENIYSLEVINYNPIYKQITSPQQIENNENLNHIWFVCLQSSLVFYSQYGKFPGPGDENQLNQIIQQQKKYVFKLNEDIGIEFIQEICRYEGAQLHNIVAFLGGIVAQESVKLITEQFLPINNTFIFNGITCEGLTIDL
ncbi:nedd8 activating enzyme e1 subunit 1, putative [Ichthyophthirius multifiliis]|uniref:Nedd8 activating enzyme e1 subunit 1, putative n=1 Tax=Ichthyophthirius multifiliis TaxID=5932 RepID=G0QXG7_ICHMU|nr:nedd8 activating enzyme e1 subunit 1, putative [Ichthyophthirius multifiliis]EGR30085.1 nedd8 activating enzyme e1 subunit 1, putative [Ichthyophthirius multifiliis]|eukprot:XP_004031321.1 nedd8 activating enzyme e1 subunit 1, putative [Ichthyophthirius multifiliis]